MAAGVDVSRRLTVANESPWVSTDDDLDAGERVAGGVGPGREGLRPLDIAGRDGVASLADIADEGDGGLGGGGGGGQGGEQGQQGRGGEPEGFPVCRRRGG